MVKHILIKEKENCCGCSACAERCPKQCISMREDEEGFLYPLIDETICIDCGLCENVCPVINQSEVKKPIVVFAAKNPNDEIRMKSSSGGVFTLLAEKIISEGGVVFGAKFSADWNVVHCFTENIEGLEGFRGSKYVQSAIGNSYKQTENFLKNGRKVLFSGTSCQIAGLKNYLHKTYNNLFTVDVICHGTPSPSVWRQYLDSIIHPKGVVGKNSVSLSLNEIPVLSGISFRDKSTGWKKYGFVLRKRSAYGADKNTVSSPLNDSFSFVKETLDVNVYMQGFLHNLYLRPSCFYCPSKKGKCGSDITLGDFWGIQNYHPEIDDDCGVSCVLLNTEKGRQIYESLGVLNYSCTYEEILRGNPSLEHSVTKPKQSTAFWKRFGNEDFSVIVYSLIKSMQPSFLRRIVRKIKSIVKIK